MIFIQQQKSLVKFHVNGIVKSIEILQELVRIILLNYTEQSSEHDIPIYIRGEKWDASFKIGAYLDIQGFLCSYENNLTGDPILMANVIFPCIDVKPPSHINTIQGIVFLRSDCCFNKSQHPFSAKIFAGTAAHQVGSSFFGNRFCLQITLLRQNTDMAKNLKAGTVIKFEGSIACKAEYNILQFIGKHIILQPAQQKNISHNYTDSGVFV